jgi:hypothetical protein
MEKSKHPISAELHPPKESRTSIILNSVGNGMMLGSIPFLGIEAYQLSVKSGHRLPPTIHGASIAVAAIGGVIGWAMGKKEADRLDHYRQAVSQEVTDLRNEVNDLKQEKRSWQEKTKTTESDLTPTR